MDLPLVSIIIPTYNTQDFIEKGINSLVNQTYSHIEILIIDDKSTDNTVEVIQTKFPQNSRIKLIQKEKNSGPASSRNIGIKNATGKYIALLDSDDYYVPDKIEKQVSVMESHPEIAVCSTYLQCFGLQNQVIKFPIQNDEIKDQQLLGCPVAHPASMFRTSFLKENNLYYDESLKFSEDYELFTRILDCQGKFITIPEPLYFYRITGNQASFVAEEGKIKKNEEQWNASKKIHYKVLSKLVNPDSSLYKEKWVEIFLKHQPIKLFQDIKPFTSWVKELIAYNEEKNCPFNSGFLQNISKQRVLRYFLNQEKLSWKIMFQYFSVHEECEHWDTTDKLKYLIKCLFFLHH